MIRLELSGKGLPTIHFHATLKTPIESILSKEAIYKRYRACGFPVAPSTIKNITVKTRRI